MDLLQEIDDYIKESIEHSLGLPVSTHTLELKLRASEESHKRLRGQYLSSQIRLKEKDEIIERARAESSMNAQALRKFVEENQKLAVECTNLLDERKSLEKEFSLYEHDREALMDFANEADERARKAEIRGLGLEEELSRIAKEVQSYKHQCEMPPVDSSLEGLAIEHYLLDSLLTTLVGNNKVASTANVFLEANGGIESCQKLCKLSDSMTPLTQKVLALVAEVETLRKDKEHLRTNLTRAEEEVNLLFKENKLLDKENKSLMKQQKERHHSGSGSGDKCTSSASAKGNKRKFRHQTCSPIKGKIEFAEVDSPRKALSSLRHNSPESRMYKK